MTEQAAHPFFLETAGGRRLCIYHPPRGAARGAVMLVPPFGDEMNKSRRMLALQARRLAQSGYAVLLPDLHGCGDSDGELADARWDGWKADLSAAAAWIALHGHGPLFLLGVRLGALLALDWARSANQAVAGFVLWQPVASGAAFLTQLLRLKLAGEMATGAEGAGTASQRAALARGETLEIGGYEITPALAADLSGLELGALAPAAGRVHWFEMAARAGASAVSPATERLATAWRADRVTLETAVLACPPFWASQEIAECPALLEATVDALDAMRA